MNKFLWNLNQDITIFIQKNVGCKIPAILSWHQCVNKLWRDSVYCRTIIETFTKFHINHNNYGPEWFALKNCAISPDKISPGTIVVLPFPGNPETSLKLKSSEILFVHYLFLRRQIVSKFCTEQGSVTAVLCAKFQNNWTKGCLGLRN